MHVPLSKSVSRFAALGLLALALVLLHATLVRPLSASWRETVTSIEDARVLARRQGLNPDLWVDVKRTLPLLSRYEYYSTAKYGFCRGGEALVLTENIRSYYDILRRFEDPHEPGFGPFTRTAQRDHAAATASAERARSEDDGGGAAPARPAKSPGSR